MATARRARLRSGFTLIEVVVVLLIVAVATAAVVPALRGPPRDDEMTAAARQLDDLFRLARDSALRGGGRVTVAIDSTSSRVWLFAGSDISLAGAGAQLELPPGVRIELSRARAEFEFMPGGAAFGDSLVLRSGATDALVTIDPWTGHAVVH